MDPALTCMFSLSILAVLVVYWVYKRKHKSPSKHIPGIHIPTPEELEMYPDGISSPFCTSSNTISGGDGWYMCCNCKAVFEYYDYDDE